MSDESDEDVIFEGSPIYKHLQEIGYTDFEAEAALSHSLAEFSEEAPNMKETKERLKREIIRCVTESKLINYSDQLLLEHFLPEGVSQLDW
ncbi:vezatin-like isoform X2 [Penaeus monodon]|uniref:vezatin-like isoform X2 n=1 Tax=Penaeus monodon TaxID=6687 RepID=UPI0018A7BC17|nr:vezatin-like isoform X2 [Penaeus monodon]